jgi:glycosyltransferase involved in cell wall biosynthesis
MQKLNSEKHKTLICTSFYTPEKGAAPHRVTSMSENLFGSVTVITPLPNYPTGKIFKNQLKWIFKKEKVNDVSVIRYWCLPSNSNSSVLRMFSMIVTSAFAFLTMFRHLLLNRDYSVVIVQTPPLTSALAYVSAARVFRLKVVLNVSDVWPSTAVDLGAMKKGSLSWKLFTLLENYIYQHSTAFLGQSQETIEYLNGKREIPSLLFRNLSPIENDSFLPKTGKIRIIYAGLLGVAQDVLAICKNIDYEALNTELHIYGDGNQKNEILTLDKKGIVYHEPVSKKEIQRLMANYDFSLIPLRTYIFGAFPSKITAAVASAIPVLFLGEGEGAKLVSELNIGISLKFDEFDSLSEYLISYSENREEAARNFYNNLSEAQLKSFDIAKNNQNLINFLRRL